MIALRITLFSLLLTGVAYPLVVTLGAKLLFSDRAAGSFVTDERGKVVGSSLIAQKMDDASYFHPRPSAAAWDASASSGSNLATGSKKLRARVEGDASALRSDEPIPAELLFASGSGLDPHISVEAALWQLPRVAKARGVEPSRVRAVLDDHIEGRDLGLFGEPRVNVLVLDLAMDRVLGRQRE